MFLDYAENEAKKQIPMKMSDWIKKLEGFLEFNDYSVLNSLGMISKEQANKKAIEEYEVYRIIQDREYKSDFDNLIEDSKKIKK